MGTEKKNVENLADPRISRFTIEKQKEVLVGELSVPTMILEKESSDAMKFFAKSGSMQKRVWNAQVAREILIWLLVPGYPPR